MSLRDRLRRRSTPSVPETSAVDTVAESNAAAVAEANGNGNGNGNGVSHAESVLSTLEMLTPPAFNAASLASRTDQGTDDGSSLGLGTAPAQAPLSAVDRIKVDLHRRLVDRLDLDALEKITDPNERNAQIRAAVMEFLRGDDTPLSQQERDEIVEQVLYEITGLGPIEPLVRDPTISDILVNNPRDIYIERRGRLTKVDTAFRNDAHLLAVIDRIVSRVGRRVDESSPMVDARLPDGSRVNAIIPPLALDGPVLSIRRFGAGLAFSDLLQHGAFSPGMAAFLAGCVRAKLNVLISGGTGSGKTTMLNALSAFIPDEERIVTIEDAAELRLQQAHVVRLETRPANLEGRGEVTARDLVRNALRMRPNRIIIGEVRGLEAIDMLQAMNTGHEGSLATVHANSPRDAIARLETMILTGTSALPIRAIRDQIGSTLDVIVQVNRQTDGSRRVTSVHEVTGLEGDNVITAPLFEFERKGFADGRVVGRFRATGIRPTSGLSDRLRIAGVNLPPAIFDEEGAFDTPDSAAQTMAAVSSMVDNTQAMRQQSELRALREALEEERRAAAALREQLAESQRDRAVAPMLAFVESIDELTRAATKTEDAHVREEAEQFKRRTDWFVEALGLDEIGDVGRPFNDDRHEIVGTTRASAAHPKNTVVEVRQRGFALNGRVARRAQVIVAK